jgi:osmotically inducible lipoprotein OsmB
MFIAFFRRRSCGTHSISFGSFETFYLIKCQIASRPGTSTMPSRHHLEFQDQGTLGEHVRSSINRTPNKNARTATTRRGKEYSIMRKIFIFGIGAVFAALATLPAAANAQEERIFTGAAIGAGTGAVIAGPPGTVVSGVVGAVVGGPSITHHRCWMDDDGDHRCRSN